MVQNVIVTEWTKIQACIFQLEQEGLVTRTFRRLDPERQNEIILAILAEATEKGPTRVNVKAVAKRAGTAVGTLYTYFPNREGMLNFVIELVTRFTLEEMVSYRPIFLTMPIREALNLYLAGGIEWSQLFAGFIQLFARAAYQGDPQLQERLVRPVANLLRSIVHDMLVEAIQRGEVRPDIDLEATSRVVHALTIAIGDSQLLPYLNTYFQVSDGTVSPEQSLKAMIELIMQGIGKDQNV
jgi:AcrR family transcriptional regulator